MKNLLLLALCFLPLIGYSQFNWHQLDIPAGGRYDDIWFTDENRGVGVNAFGNIYKTIDGGLTWDLKLNTSNYMRSVEFFDTGIGIAGSLDYHIYRTTDGGDTWTDIMSAFPDSVSGLCGLYAVNDSTMYAVGVVLQPAYVLKTTDRGITWSYIDMNSYARYLVDCYFIDEDTGFVFGQAPVAADGGIILRTTDGGITWQSVFTTDVSYDILWKIQAVNDTMWVASVDNFLPSSGPTRLYFSHDQGETWEMKIVTNTYHYIQMVGFINPQTGWCGAGTYLAVTHDGGNTWQTDNTTVNAINRFFPINDHLAYVGGEYVYRIDTSSVPTNVAATASAGDFHQIDLLGSNPSDGSIEFQYSIGQRTRLALYLCDNQGRVVHEFFRGWKEKGIYAAGWKSDCPSGIYYIVMQSHEGVIAKKMVVEHP